MSRFRIGQEKVIRFLPEANSFNHLSAIAQVSRSSVTRIVKENNLDYSHFKPGRGRWLKESQILVKDSKSGNGIIKNLIIREKLLDYACILCGQKPYWNGKKLTLQLDHINGDSRDSRLVNLRFLCPNCHTQTDTYTGRNINGIKK